VLFNNGGTNVNNGWPSLSVVADSSSNNLLGLIPPQATAVAILEVQYSFFVAGPSGSSAPVFIAASGSVTGNSQDTFQLSGGSINITSPNNGQWNISSVYNLTTNQIYTVTLLAESQSDASSGCPNGSLCLDKDTATVDPMIYIDPNFASASDYTIVFSDGINVGSIPGAVPEPSTWAMMLLGFVGLGFAFQKTADRGGKSAVTTDLFSEDLRDRLRFFLTCNSGHSFSNCSLPTL
jgi:hypothetical protein